MINSANAFVQTRADEPFSTTSVREGTCIVRRFLAIGSASPPRHIVFEGAILKEDGVPKTGFEWTRITRKTGQKQESVKCILDGRNRRKNTVGEEQRERASIAATESEIEEVIFV